MPILHHSRLQCIVVMVCCALGQYYIFYYTWNRVPTMVSIRQMFAAPNNSFSTRSEDQLITPVYQRVLYVEQSDMPVTPIADKEEDTFDTNCTCSYDGHMYRVCQKKCELI